MFNTNDTFLEPSSRAEDGSDNRTREKSIQHMLVVEDSLVLTLIFFFFSF